MNAQESPQHHSAPVPISLKGCPERAEVLPCTAVSSGLPRLDLATGNKPPCQGSLRFGDFNAGTGLLQLKHFLDSESSRI